MDRFCGQNNPGRPLPVAWPARTLLHLCRSVTHPRCCCRRAQGAVARSRSHQAAVVCARAHQAPSGQRRRLRSAIRLFRRAGNAACIAVGRRRPFFGHRVATRAGQGFRKMLCGFSAALPVATMDKSGGPEATKPPGGGLMGDGLQSATDPQMPTLAGLAESCLRHVWCRRLLALAGGERAEGHCGRDDVPSSRCHGVVPRCRSFVDCRMSGLAWLRDVPQPSEGGSRPGARGRSNFRRPTGHDARYARPRRVLRPGPGRSRRWPCHTRLGICAHLCSTGRQLSADAPSLLLYGKLCIARCLVFLLRCDFYSSSHR